jgi:hypothetical protein
MWPTAMSSVILLPSGMALAEIAAGASSSTIKIVNTRNSAVIIFHFLYIFLGCSLNVCFESSVAPPKLAIGI